MMPGPSRLLNEIITFIPAVGIVLETRAARWCLQRCRPRMKATQGGRGCSRCGRLVQRLYLL